MSDCTGKNWYCWCLNRAPRSVSADTARDAARKYAQQQRLPIEAVVNVIRAKEVETFKVGIA